MTTQENPQDTASFIVKGQYIKDLSFENPHAPGSLFSLNAPPKIEVNVDLRAGKLQDNIYELTMLLAARASSENAVLFLVELAYGGIFEITGASPERIEQIIMVDCPFVLFPFARRVISDVTRDGGFPPLMLDPIDFNGLYQHNKNKIA